MLSFVVHALGADLYLNPVAVRTHHRELQGLIARGLGMGYPVAYAVGVDAVERADDGIDAPAVELFEVYLLECLCFDV